MEEIPLHHLDQPEENGIPFKILRMEEVWDSAEAIHADRHTFYTIFWIKQGRGTHVIDFAEYAIQPNSFYFLAPGQVHDLQIEVPFQGYVILFLPELFQLDSAAANFLQTIDVFDCNQHEPLMYPSTSFVEQLRPVIESLFTEYHREEAFGRRTAVCAWLQLVLVNLQRRYMAEVGVPEDSEAQLASQFMQLVRDHAITDHNVQDYADRLGVTAGYLSETVKMEMGQTAGTLIRQQLALEAKRLLVHSDLTVGEIAYQLHFADAAYFSRFYKRETKQSPTDFRAGFRKKYLTTHH